MRQPCDRSKTTLLRYFYNLLPFRRFSVYVALKKDNLKNKKRRFYLLQKANNKVIYCVKWSK